MDNARFAWVVFRTKCANAVHFAVRRGELVKPSICFACGRNTVVEAHHWDYTRVLEVEWVCRDCHRDIHRKHDYKVNRGVRIDEYIPYPVNILVCRRCGHDWAGRKSEKPVTCPSCRSAYWDKEKVRK